MTTASVSRERDTAFAEQLIAHHAVMVADLDRLSAALADAVAAGTGHRCTAPRPSGRG